jgi:hypothetical protein
MGTSLDRAPRAITALSSARVSALDVALLICAKCAVAPRYFGAESHALVGDGVELRAARRQLEGVVGGSTRRRART